jgi:hypothetical protein
MAAAYQRLYITRIECIRAAPAKPQQLIDWTTTSPDRAGLSSGSDAAKQYSAMKSVLVTAASPAPQCKFHKVE